MFTRLVASQPTHERAMKGFMFSTLLHGSLIAAAVLLTSTEAFDTLIDEPREIPITLARPRPEPTPVERSAPVSAPDAPTIVTRAPVVEIVISPPTTVPTTIPDPTDLPWTSIADAPTGVGRAGGSAGAETGVPMTGPSVAYSEAYVDVPVSLGVLHRTGAGAQLARESAIATSSISEAEQDLYGLQPLRAVITENLVEQTVGGAEVCHGERQRVSLGD